MTWQRLRLGDLVEIKHGFAFAGSQFSDDPRLPVVVTPGNFAIGGGFQERDKTFAGDVPDGFEFAPGDLIVTMTDLSKSADTLGMAAMIPRSGRRYLHNQRVGKVILKRPDLVDLWFLSFYLRGGKYRSHVVATASGSTVKHTSPGRIEQFIADMPDLRAQQAIAAVLGALDEKIAVNAAVARTADELARAHFRKVSASLKPTIMYEKFASIGGGGTPSTKRPELWGDAVCWATPTDVTALDSPYLSNTSRRITTEGLDHCASPLYPAGSILMTSRATIGAFALAEVPMAVNQGFIVANAKQPDLNVWLFHEMRSRVTDYLAASNGATFLELSKGRFKSLKMLVTTPDVMVAFGDQVRPLHDVARHAMTENGTLAELRNTLLPALMSGRLGVKDAERQVEDAV